MIILTQSPIHAMMHGVAYFELRGQKCTAVYTDATRETATISKANADAIRAYYKYQTTDGAKPAPEPNGFSIVGDIQAKRPDDDYAERRDFESERNKGIARGGINL